VVLVACSASVAVRMEIDDGLSRLRLGGEGVVLRAEAREGGREAEVGRGAGASGAAGAEGEMCDGDGAMGREIAATTEAGDHSATVRATGGLAAARS